MKSWEEEFESFGADGVDFYPVCNLPTKEKIIDSFTKEKFLNGCVYPRSSHIFYKIIDGKKYYILNSSEFEFLEYKNSQNSCQCYIIEEDNELLFSTKITNLLREGYKISSSSCNSKNYKAILIKEDN